MSKRVFNPKPSDFFPTPFSAAAPLAATLPLGTRFQEPCAGDGSLILSMARWAHQCTWACDIEPRVPGVAKGDGSFMLNDDLIVTNPPFSWGALRPLLDAWVGHREAWLLLPWDMPANARFVPYASHIDRVIPLGRVSWQQNGRGGFENYGWFRFTASPANFILSRVKVRHTC